MMAPLRVLAALTATALTACAAAVSASPVGQAPDRTAGSYPAHFVAAVSGRTVGLAVFSAASGRMERLLVRSPIAYFAVPVAVSPDGRFVYYNNVGPVPVCPRNGFTEPALWRVPVSGGRPSYSGLNTNGIAFSPDARMVAYLATGTCGHTIWIIVRNRRTGATRRIVLWRNNPDAASAITSAELSWSPDDRHLAVGLVIAAAIESITVIDARRTTNVEAAPPIRPCAGRRDICLDPAFDVRGRLTFLRFLNLPTGLPGQIMRWQDGRAVSLGQLSPDQSAGGAASIAVDRAGGAILLVAGSPFPETWRWSGGRFHVLIVSTRNRQVSSPIWLG